RGGEVMYTPHALKYFMRNEICWILLHEEYHCSTFIGEIPFISESPGIKYANEKILLFDPKIILDDLLKSIGAHWREYKETLPPINKKMRFYFVDTIPIIVSHRFPVRLIGIFDICAGVIPPMP